MKTEMNYVIYGAQGYALGTYEAVKTIYPERNISCFVVTKKEGNPKTLANLPVTELESFCAKMTQEEKNEVHVMIATPENVQDEIENTLRQNGFTGIERIDSKKWAELSGKYHAKLGIFTPLNTLPEMTTSPGSKLETKPSSEIKTVFESTTSEKNSVEKHIHIYMAKSDKDKPLKTPVSLPQYMHPVQVGAAVSKERIADISDDTGDNISTKNCNYCELTALYWMWKNVLTSADTGRYIHQDKSQKNSRCNADDYYGLAQYRRMLILSDEELLQIKRSDIDAILPYPLLYEPDINMHHKRYLKDSDWDVLLCVLKELYPDQMPEYEKILKQRFMYNYNVILAKKSVLKDYCEWLFPILAKVEEMSVPKECDRSDRYIGYMGEVLESLYFMANSKKLSIAHTGLRLYV